MKLIFSGATLTEASIGKARLMDAVFKNANLQKAHLREAILHNTNFQHADLTDVEASFADCSGTDFSNATLVGINLRHARLEGTRLMGSNLTGSFLWFAHLQGCDLTNSVMSNANLNGTRMIHSNLSNADMTGCRVYGISAWDLNLTNTIQKDLLIGNDFDETMPSKVTVDNLEVAQFIYILMKNEKIRNVIDTITSKVVLILGSFIKERKKTLDAIKRRLSNEGYVPIIFDFKPSDNRDLTETIQSLASMARFVIADLTDAKSIPQELSAIVPHMPSVPVQPIILSSQREYAMFEHWRKFPWVLPEFLYKDEDHLIDNLALKVIHPVNTWKEKNDTTQTLKDEIAELKRKLALLNGED